MRKRILLVISLAALAALAQDAPTAPPTAPVRHGAARAAPLLVEPSAPLPRIDVHAARRMREAATADALPAKTTPDATAGSVTTRTMTYDVPEQRVVNPTPSFRFVSLKEPDKTRAAKPAARDD